MHESEKQTKTSLVYKHTPKVRSRGFVETNEGHFNKKNQGHIISILF